MEPLQREGHRAFRARSCLPSTPRSNGTYFSFADVGDGEDHFHAAHGHRASSPLRETSRVTPSPSCFARSSAFALSMHETLERIGSTWPPPPCAIIACELRAEERALLDGGGAVLADADGRI
jgi:hypothetical protein